MNQEQEREIYEIKINELVSDNTNKNTIDFYRGINEFKKGY
jgi:hypothetical protein